MIEKRGRPKGRAVDKTIALRLSDEMVERIEAHAGRLAAAAPGVNVRTSDAVRALLIVALDHVEQAAGIKKRSK